MAPSRLEPRFDTDASPTAVDDVRAKVTSRFREVVQAVDEQLSRFPAVTQIASAVGIRPCIIPVAAVALLSILFGVFDNLISLMIGFIYPAYQSFKAIETTDRRDDKQWLCYWICFAAFSLVEVFSDFLLFWMPLYYIVKVAFLLWLFLPQFKGATILYHHVIRPMLLRHQGNIDNALHNTENLLTSAAQATAQAAVQSAAQQQEVRKNR